MRVHDSTTHVKSRSPMYVCGAAYAVADVLT